MGYTPPQLEARKITGGWAIYPPNNTTTDDLTIYPNTTDTTAFIKILGNAGVTIEVADNSTMALNSAGGVNRFNIWYTSPDVTLESKTSDKNLFLKTNGTGVVKFGTYTGGAATESTGYISILDASGNARKLMVQA